MWRIQGFLGKWSYAADNMKGCRAKQKETVSKRARVGESLQARQEGQRDGEVGALALGRSGTASSETETSWE